MLVINTETTHVRVSNPPTFDQLVEVAALVALDGLKEYGSAEEADLTEAWKMITGRALSELEEAGLLDRPAEA